MLGTVATIGLAIAGGFYAAAAGAWFAKKISRKMSMWRHGIPENKDSFKPSGRAIAELGPDNANQLSEIIFKQLQTFHARLRELKN